MDVQNGLIDDDDPDSETDASQIIPLVVNTMGWIKGLGSELAKNIEDIIEPSVILEIDSTSSEEDWTRPVPREYNSKSSAATIHLVESVSSSPLSTQYSAADRRILSILSYFHAMFPPQISSKPTKLVAALAWATSSPLCNHPPYEVNWKVAFDQIVLTGAGAEDIVPEEALKVLNCSIVGLVECDTEPFVASDINGEETHDLLPYTQGASPPSPFHSVCQGLALIRSLSDSPSVPFMHMLTPLPPQLLKSRVLVKGELELPVWGMLDFRTVDTTGDIAGVEKGRVPYLRWGKGEGVGGERRRVRRNLMRKGQM